MQLVGLGWDQDDPILQMKKLGIRGANVHQFFKQSNCIKQPLTWAAHSGSQQIQASQPSGPEKPLERK
jgi:hypothetical protein